VQTPIDFTPVHDRSLRLAEFAASFSHTDLIAATHASIDHLLAIIEPADDAAIAFIPVDPHAHDPYAVSGEEHIGWSLGHLIAHVTASSEENAAVASLLARAYGVDEHTCFLIDLAARMHDIGKLTVPDSILLKPGRLTADERAIMESHTTSGARILARANVPQMYVAEEIARHHHERWDGAGYPARLRGSNIPLAARITALADVYDALTHVRPYKHAWTSEEALREIARLRGTHFDPQLTDLFLRLVPDLTRAHPDLDAYLAAEAGANTLVASRARIVRALAGDDAALVHVDDPRR
jgi:putative nucleotidyltransferase with HDIG domain